MRRLLAGSRILVRLKGLAAIGLAAWRRPRARPTVNEIDALLPQTQCGQCGYAGCRPYAEAIAEGRADINRCPPGGAAGVRDLARLLGRPPKPLDPAYGSEQPRRLAWIDEEVCIGCTRCIQACPVDAILGAAHQMHTVIETECTGCELCVAPCPVDCIHMLPAADEAIAPPLARVFGGLAARRPERRKADLARERYRRRQQRLQREQAEAAAKRLRRKEALAGAAKPTEAMKKAVIAAALARAKQKKSGGR